MNYFLYILRSLTTDTFYVGSSEDYEKRVQEHNNGHCKATRPYRPYALIYLESYQTRREAVRREREIKSYKKRRFIESLIRSTGRVPSPIPTRS